MNGSIKLAHLACLAVLASLTIVSPGLQAQNSVPNAASATSVPRTTLSAAQLKKLAMLMAKYGKDASLSSDSTAALGISKGDEVLTLPQLTSNKPPLLRAYIPLPDGGMLLGLLDNDGDTARSYRLDANQKLVVAVSKTNRGGAPIVIPMSVAERNVEIELTYWSALADRH